MSFDTHWWQVLLGLIVLFYCCMPLLIYLTQKLPAHPQLQVLDLHNLESSLARFLMEQTNALLAIGFDEPTLVQIPHGAPNVKAYLIMLVNRQTGDHALVTSLVGNASIRTSYVEFSTRFAGGEVFDTYNSPELNSFPPGPTTVRTVVPMVTDAQELFRLHAYIMNKHGAAGRRDMYEPGQSLDYLTHYAFTVPYGRMTERGWLRYEASSDRYCVTLKGAYLMTWGLLQPIKALRKMAMYYKAKRILADFRETAAMAERR